MPSSHSKSSSSRDAKKSKQSSSYAMQEMQKLVTTVCNSILLDTANLDVSEIDFELARAINSRHEELTKSQVEQIKEAVISRLRNAFEDDELGGIPEEAIDAYSSTAASAEPGQDLDLIQLLCPKVVNGQVVSFAAGHKLPEDFDMSTCPTTNVLSKLLNRHNEKPNAKVEVGEVRWKCKEECCSGSKHCKKCTPEEGMPLAKVYSLLALLFFLIGGRFNFYNAGGVSTLIEENLASHLVKEYFGIIKNRGYHLSLATYFLP